ncbi:cobalamin-dependent protein [Streptomyces sp. NPDC097619]|uniref:cobalamin B12-binding domain-containing protein n=1 Tax=Streptomyces sp. NPDC097619 TaxID=3157228 RepID=UPI00332C4376
MTPGPTRPGPTTNRAPRASTASAPAASTPDAPADAPVAVVVEGGDGSDGSDGGRAPDDGIAASADLLWEAVAAGEEPAATAVVTQGLDAGLDPERVLLDVIARVQARVGEEWMADRFTVAQEHAATAINERVVGVLARHRSAARTGPHRGRITVACIDGEWHALPARLLAEVLKLRGWRVDYLGAQVPTPHLIAHLHRTATDAVALSASIPTRLPAAHAAITACQAVGVPVIVGGAAFGADGRYARLLGADAWAPDARTAAEDLGRGGPAAPRPDHQVIDDLPHLADQEYTLVTRARTRLVAAVFAGLEESYPALRSYSEEQRERTAEDLAHITEFLAAALYTGDEELFTDFLLWTAEVLTARGVPAMSLPPALTLLGQELQDFPRATALLRTATDLLVTRHRKAR